MHRPFHCARLNVDELERRDAPAVLSYAGAAGNGAADIITVQLDKNGSKIRIFDDGKPAGNGSIDTTEKVTIAASTGEGDSLVIDYTSGYFATPIWFSGGGASAAAAKVVAGGGTVSLDFSTSAQSITADIGLNTTTVTFSGGGSVTVKGTVSAVTGTDGNDKFIDNTTIETLSLNGGLGDDWYVLNPGSSITVTDDGGSETIDFSLNDQSITADFGTTFTQVTDADGLVTFYGTAEAGIGTIYGDTFIDNTTIELLSLNGGLGDDTYMLHPGSSITVTDDGGTDTISLAGNTTPTGSPDAITATVGTTMTTVTDSDGDVTFFGILEAVWGTDGNDTFIDESDTELVSYGGGLGFDTYDLQPGSSINIYEAGTGNLIKMPRARFKVNVDLSKGEITDTQGNAVLIKTGAVSNFAGTAFADTISGDGGNNVFYLGAGDSADGGAGDDTYYVVAGGNISITDSSGNDVLDFSQTTTTGVTVDLSRTNGSAQNIATGATLSLKGVIETLIGTNQNDTLSGSDGNETLVGLGGDDRLQGQSGDDVLLGGSGNDELNGGAGRDILVGGSGSDKLNAGAGEDILIAGYTSYDMVLVGPSPGTLTDQVDLAAWSAIRDIWSGSGDAKTRARAINTGATYRLRASGTGQTVFGDGAADTLTGSQSTDWYFATTGEDTITDKDNTEFFNDGIPV